MREYLSDRLRATLMTQLKPEDQKRWNEEIAPCDKLEESIRDILFAINSNENIRTLCSTKMERGIGEISYLLICFSKSIEAKINDEIMPYFMQAHNRPAEFVKGFKLKDETKFSGGVNHTSNYPTLQTFSLILKSSDTEAHDQFWNDIQSRLSNI